jgi:exopolysaccharide production protein ExoZ
MKQGTIVSIQYLRGFAAFSVVWFHAAHSGHSESILGTTGVDLFFVISGFIMVATSENLSPGRFMALRLIRVVPLYWLVTLLAIVLAPLGHHLKGINLSPAVIVKSLAFIPYDSIDFPGRLWPILVQGWTLNYEMFFYALFALSLWLPRGRIAALVAVLGCLALTGSMTHMSPASPAYIYVSPMLLEFAAGMVIGEGYLRGWRQQLWLACLSIPIGLWYLRGGLQFQMTIIGAILLVIAATYPKVPAWDLPRAIGDSSYSIYLTHPFVLAAVVLVWKPVAEPGILYVVVACVASIAAGWFCYEWVERPMTKCLRRRAEEFAAKKRISQGKTCRRNKGRNHL